YRAMLPFSQIATASRPRTSSHTPHTRDRPRAPYTLCRRRAAPWCAVMPCRFVAPRASRYLASMRNVVLVACADAELAERLIVRLDAAGFQCLSATTGSEALATAASYQ